MMLSVSRKSVENPDWIATLKKGDRVTYAYGGNASGHPPSKATVRGKGKTFIEVFVDSHSSAFPQRLGRGGIQGSVQSNCFKCLAPIEQFDAIAEDAAQQREWVVAEDEKYAWKSPTIGNEHQSAEKRWVL
jgi:hypothetical protein